MDHLNEDILRSLLEQRLTPVAQAQVRRHLKTCYRCEQKLEQWRASFESLSAEEPSQVRATETRPGREPTILVPPDPESARSTWARRITRTALMVAVVLLAALAIDTLRQVRNQPAEPANGMPLATTSEAALAGLDAKPATPSASDSASPDTTAQAVPVASTPADTTPPPAAQPQDPVETDPLPTSEAFRRITVKEAIERLGRPLKLIGGLYPDHVEIADVGQTPPGALPGTPVVRVVYRDPSGSILHLDQQELPEAYQGGFSTDTLIDSEPGGSAMAAWVTGTTRLTLSGNIPEDILRIYVRRVD